MAFMPQPKSSTGVLCRGGVVCCYTGAEEVLPFCQYGLQSVAWLMLPCEHQLHLLINCLGYLCLGITASASMKGVSWDHRGMI